MKRLTFLLGLLISALLVVLLFARLDFAKLWSAAAAANYLYLLPITFFLLAGTWLRALRWRRLLLPVKRMSVSHLFGATVIGYAANNLLPARVGEFLRAHVIGRLEKVSRAAAFASIIVERLFDGLSILLILTVILPWLQLPAQDWLVAASWLALLFYLAVLAFVLLLNYKSQPTLQLTNSLLFWLPPALTARLLEALGSLSEGLKIIRDGWSLAVIFAYSLLIWAVTAGGLYLTVIAFGYQFTFLPALFLLIIMTFAVILPSAPGFVGTLDAAMVYGLMLFSLPREAALTMTIFYHGWSFLLVVILGFYYLGKYNLRLKA